MFTKIVAVLFAFVALSIYLGHWSAEDARRTKAAEEAAQRQAEQARVAAMTPEQRAEEARQLEERERARREAELRRLGLKWNYAEHDDAMGRGKIRSASVNSLNEIEFDFPYRGAQRATLQLRSHPRHGKDVILFIQRGQFLCRLGDCNVQVRFGSGKPLVFSASEPADHSTTVLFIRNYNRFVNGIRRVDMVYIEAQFFQEGDRVFKFDVSGLNWQ